MADQPLRAWQRMLSGRRLDLLDPSPLDVEIEDIAHGLSRVARWNGQTVGTHAFSVAQHSMIVETIYRQMNSDASPEQLLTALLHDAPEYVIGDMISPFKAVVGGGYKAVESRLESAIHVRFGLPAATPATLKAKIKKADHVAAFFEATQLAGFADREARQLFGTPRRITLDMLAIEPLPTADIERSFLARFAELDALRTKGSRI